MADQIGFYGSLPSPRSAEEIEADRRDRAEWEARKEREARERAILAAVDAGFEAAHTDILYQEILAAAAKAAIDSILESMGDYSWY